VRLRLQLFKVINEDIENSEMIYHQEFFDETTIYNLYLKIKDSLLQAPVNPTSEIKKERKDKGDVGGSIIKNNNISFSLKCFLDLSEAPQYMKVFS
jgi:hypothetical protein